MIDVLIKYFHIDFMRFACLTGRKLIFILNSQLILWLFKEKY